MAKTIQELKDERSAVSAQIDEILKADSLTDEQRTECTRLEGEFDSLGEQIKAAEAREAEDRERRDRAAARNRELSAANPRRTAHATPGATPRITKEEGEDDPQRGFKSPREFIARVMDAGRGIKVDNRLRPLATAGSDEQSGASDPYGGFLVPIGFTPNVLSVQAEADPFAGRTMQVPMENAIVKIPARVDKNHTSSVSGGLTVSRREETVAATASRAEYEQVTLQAFSLFGLSYATEELLTDSPASFAALLAAGFSDEFTARLINERLNGTGVGEFLGAINSPCFVSQAKETGQAAASIQYENIVKMRSRCWGYGNAIWLANHDTMPQLMLLNQSVGTGGVPVWQPSAREDAPDLLMGRPLIFTEFCQTLGTVGDIVIFNGTQYLEGLYEPLQSAESVHVRFVNHERAFKFWVRNAGAPWWRSALTPKNSSTTLSPFVGLATRA